MSFFGKLTSIAFNTVTLPLEVVKDVVTLGGLGTDQDTPYTLQKCKKIQKTIDDLSEDE